MRNEEMLKRISERRTVLEDIKKRKAAWKLYTNSMKGVVKGQGGRGRIQI